MENFRITCTEDCCINKEFFQKQVIFSIDISIGLKNFGYILENKALYYDFNKGEHYFSISEGDPGYSNVLLKGKDIGIKFNKKGDLYWLSFTGVTKGNEKIKELLNGKDLRSIKNGMIFPLVLNKGGRAYYLYQYDEKAESEVTEHLIKMQKVFEEIFGMDSFRIEKISDAENFCEIFNYGTVNEQFYEIEIHMPYEGPSMRGIQRRISLEPTENEFIIKYDGEYYVLNLPEIIKNLKIPSGPLLNAFNEITERIAFSSYYESVCENGVCKVKWIYEERFLPDVLEVLNKIINSGGKIAISKLKKLNFIHEENKNIEFERISMEFFKKEMILSKDISILPELNELIDSGILYYNAESMDLYMIIKRDSPDYPEIKLKSLKNNIKFNENKFFFWLSYPDITKTNKDLIDRIKNNRVYNWENVYHIPFFIAKDGRMYYKILYNLENEQSIISNLLKFYNSHVDVLGINSYRVEKIGNSESILKFIQDFNLNIRIVEIEITFDYSGKNMKGLVRNLGPSLDYIEFIIDEGNDKKLININEIDKKIPIFGTNAKEFFKNLINNHAFFIHIEFVCLNNNCKVRSFIEEKMVTVFINGLDELIGKGLKRRISKYNVLII